MSSIEKAYVHEIEITQLTKDDQTTVLAKLRVFVGRAFLNNDQEFEDKHGYWIDVELWGNKANHLHVIEKGASIQMTGNYLMSKWKDKEDNSDRERMIFRAKEIAILPRSVESITYKKRGSAPSEQQAA